MVRGPFVGLLLAGVALTPTACGAGGEAGEAAENEEEIRFRTDKVDTSLPDVDALGYDIGLRVSGEPGSETFRADVKGTFVATRALSELVLDFDGNEIDKVYVGGRVATHRRDGAKLILELPSPIASGKTFSTRITYRGDVAQAAGQDPNDFSKFGGFMVKQRNAEGKRIFTTLSWPSKARRWLPLRDHPADGAMVAFTVTWPKSFTVLANGRKVSETDNADGTKTWRYEAMTIMPAYDFHVSAYEHWVTGDAASQSNVPIKTFAYPRSAAAVEPVYGDLPRVMDFFESAFGAYRWGSVAFIEEPIFGGGMEHAGVVSMDETLFSDRAGARHTAFHELAHHWSGNLVRIRRWNDFWISEGFTEYLTARALAAVDGPEAERATYRSYLKDALDADGSDPHALAPRGDEIDVLTIFDAIPYQKGALTLRLLERVVGTETMDRFLKTWFRSHAFQAVTTEALEQELSAASGKDLSKFFASFVYRGGHPEVNVTFAPVAGGETEITVEQVQSEPAFHFPLDLDLVSASGAAERVVVDLTAKTTKTRVRLAGAPSSVVVDPDERALLVATCGQTGGGSCRSGYRCASRGAVSTCRPM